jgi:hypothetical protein
MHISVAGFCFLPLGSSYVPTPELVSFLENGPPPVYIGFGSVVVEDPKALMVLILLAVELAGVRAVIGKGWADLAEDSLPPNVFIVDNCPHDWLFKHVSCVVHHGGAGTTSAGVAAGKPTVVVPFFGDQPFWGDMIARAGAGPRPLPFKTLTATSLATAITAALDRNVSANARRLGAKIANEKGSETAAKSFHDRLPLGTMGCSVIPRRAAVWQLRKSEIQLSALAATVLRKEGLVAFKQLELYLFPASAPESDLTSAGIGHVSTISITVRGNQSREVYWQLLRCSTKPSKELVRWVRTSDAYIQTYSPWLPHEGSSHR